MRTLALCLVATAAVSGLEFDESDMYDWAAEYGPRQPWDLQKWGECGRFVMEAIENGGISGTQY
jgi:hypothetical protein